MASRSSVMPDAPVTSNAVRATALPICTEAIATSTSTGAGTAAARASRAAHGATLRARPDARTRLARPSVGPG